MESHLFRPGFTTVAKVTEFSGTGEGLALVADAADKVGGSVEIRSAGGRGTSVTLDLPKSLILQDVVIVAVGQSFFALPAASVLGSVTISPSQQTVIDGATTISFRNESVPVISLAKVIGLNSDDASAQDALIVSTRSGLIAVTVDEIIDQRRVAVKSLGPILEGADPFDLPGLRQGTQTNAGTPAAVKRPGLRIEGPDPVKLLFTLGQPRRGKQGHVG